MNWLINVLTKAGLEFPAMTETAAFLMKDLVLLAASFYLLKQDVMAHPLDLGLVEENCHE
jgi:hypothetical protein